LSGFKNSTAANPTAQTQLLTSLKKSSTKHPFKIDFKPLRKSLMTGTSLEQAKGV
jgi:hypothetical protein